MLTYEEFEVMGKKRNEMMAEIEKKKSELKKLWEPILKLMEKYGIKTETDFDTLRKIVAELKWSSEKFKNLQNLPNEISTLSQEVSHLTNTLGINRAKIWLQFQPMREMTCHHSNPTLDQPFGLFSGWPGEYWLEKAKN